MNTMKLFVLLSVLTLAASAFGQGQQKRPEPGSISPDATSDCQSTFTSGSGQTFFQFCVTVNGNVTELQSPAGYEHIREGDYQEGYSICDFGTTTGGSETSYYDYADGGDSGNWQAPVTTQPGGANTFPLKIVRTTSDGIYTLTQTFTRDTVEPTVKIAMTLKNNTKAVRDFALVRYADIDANNAYNKSTDLFDFTHDAAWGYNQGFTLYGVMLSTVPTTVPHFAFVQDTYEGPDPCGPVNNLPASTPWSGDGSVGLEWNNSGNNAKSITATAEYRRF
jgi:hypothetical protein